MLVLLNICLSIDTTIYWCTETLLVSTQLLQQSSSDNWDQKWIRHSNATFYWKQGILSTSTDIYEKSISNINIAVDHVHLIVGSQNHTKYSITYVAMQLFFFVTKSLFSLFLSFCCVHVDPVCLHLLNYA